MSSQKNVLFLWGRQKALIISVASLTSFPQLKCISSKTDHRVQTSLEEPGLDFVSLSAYFPSFALGFYVIACFTCLIPSLKNLRCIRWIHLKKKKKTQEIEKPNYSLNDQGPDLCLRYSHIQN